MMIMLPSQQTNIELVLILIIGCDTNNVQTSLFYVVDNCSVYCCNDDVKLASQSTNISRTDS